MQVHMNDGSKRFAIFIALVLVALIASFLYLNRHREKHALTSQGPLSPVSESRAEERLGEFVYPGAEALLTQDFSGDASGIPEEVGNGLVCIYSCGDGFGTVTSYYMGVFEKTEGFTWSDNAFPEAANDPGDYRDRQFDGDLEGKHYAVTVREEAGQVQISVCMTE
jgi:hypothetical protein